MAGTLTTARPVIHLVFLFSVVCLITSA